jgi:hypothetical protein
MRMACAKYRHHHEWFQFYLVLFSVYVCFCVVNFGLAFVSYLLTVHTSRYSSVELDASEPTVYDSGKREEPIVTDAPVINDGRNRQVQYFRYITVTSIRTFQVRVVLTAYWSHLPTGCRVSDLEIKTAERNMVCDTV